MTNIERIISEGRLDIFKAMRSGDKYRFRSSFGIPMDAEGDSALLDWMLDDDGTPAIAADASE